MTISEAPPCERCGAKPLNDHAKDCGFLAMMRAVAYPDILDDNGVDWKDNLIRKLQAENLEMRLKLSKTSDESAE